MDHTVPVIWMVHIQNNTRRISTITPMDEKGLDVHYIFIFMEVIDEDGFGAGHIYLDEFSFPVVNLNRAPLHLNQCS